MTKTEQPEHNLRASDIINMAITNDHYDIRFHKGAGTVSSACHSHDTCH